MNGPTDYPSLFETDPKLTQGYAMSNGCKSDFVEALSSQVEETLKQQNLFQNPLVLQCI